MNDTIKWLATMAVIIGFMFTLFAWLTPDPHVKHGWMRYVAPAIFALGLLVFLRLEFRKDRAPDFLRSAVGDYFDRSGFCFSLASGAKGGVGHIWVRFQNRYAGECAGRIILRPLGPAARSFTNKTIEIPFTCPPAGYGEIVAPLSIPAAAQGQNVSMHVGVVVRYPKGRKRCLRFGRAMPVGANTGFERGRHTVLIALGAATGSIVLFSPASLTLPLPAGVAEQAPEGAQPEMHVIWSLDQPPVEVMTCSAVMVDGELLPP